MEKIGFKKTAELLTHAGQAGVPVFLLGSPGVGKTALIENIVGPSLGKPVVTVIASQMDAADLGLPYIKSDGTGVERALHPDIERACREGVVLFFDELNCAPQSVRAALLRLINERKVFGRPLHPDTYIVAASNPTEQAPGATDATAAETNRRLIVSFQPTLDEIRDYFAWHLGEEGSELRGLAADVSATWNKRPDLLTLDPPRASIDAGHAWASPRAWEKALRVAAAWTVGSGEPIKDDDFRLILDGTVGPEVGTGYLTIRKYRDGLPSYEEIRKNPTTAKVGNSTNLQLATLGIVGRLIQDDPVAAAVYTARLEPEAGFSLRKDLEKALLTKRGKDFAAGIAALGTINKRMADAANITKSTKK